MKTSFYNIVSSDLDFILNASNFSWESLRNKTILVSGASGFLPAYMIETLLRLNQKYDFNIKIIGLVRNIEKAKNRFLSYANDKNLNIVQHDVCKPFNIIEKIDYIIHAASNASPKYYGSDPVGTLSANVVGTQNLLELASKNQIKSFLYFSSSEVYGALSSENIPTNETMYGYLDPVKLRSCYAESKRMGENLCISYMHQYGIPVKIVRPFHTYGPGMSLNDGRVFADFVANIVNNENIQLNSDGSARRAFCYLADAVRGFFIVLLKGTSGEAYNIGYPKETSILELAHILVNLFPEKNLSVNINNSKIANGYIASTISRNCPNITKMKALGWQPQFSIEDGFRRTVESFIKD